MIANLGMYDLPGLHGLNDAYWTTIRRELGYGPHTLSRVDDMWTIWQSPDLLLAQTCGYPFRAKLKDRVQLVGTPDYGLEGCPPGHYCSVIIARNTDTRQTLADFADARFAYNEPLSQSGWAAPKHRMDLDGIAPGELIRTGSHAKSLAAVVHEAADFAALDHLTFELIRRTNPDATSAIRVIAQTEPTPTLPYITSLTQNARQIADAVERAIHALPQATREALHLKGLVQIPADAYLAVPTPTPPD